MMLKDLEVRQFGDRWYIYSRSFGGTIFNTRGWATRQEAQKVLEAQKR